MDKTGYVYILTNKNKTTLYIGVTSDLCRRIYEHKNHLIKDSFTDKYNLEHCIYFEEFSYIGLAIQREKEIKKWNRQKKEDLINKKNPRWEVLVTEHGFIRNVVPFSQQVATILNTLTQEPPPSGRNDSDTIGYNKEIPPSGRNDSDTTGYNKEIPPFGRNDSGSPNSNDGASVGGEAANACSPVSTNDSRHSERSEESPNINNNAARHIGYNL